MKDRFQSEVLRAEQAAKAEREKKRERTGGFVGKLARGELHVPFTTSAMMDDYRHEMVEELRLVERRETLERLDDLLSAFVSTVKAMDERLDHQSRLQADIVNLLERLTKGKA